jgi:uncharacterized protein (TIGR02145 family)
MKNLILFTLLCFNLSAQTPGAGVTDLEGNNYSTVIIGSQEWMAENLRTTKFANGNILPNQSNENLSGFYTTPAWDYWGQDSTMEIPYGKLYNWWAVVDPRNICPQGWHVPSDDEWNTLIGFLDPTFYPTATGAQSYTAGGKMKTIGTAFWNSPNAGATNESGFSGLPGGLRYYQFGFGGENTDGYWWSSTEINSVYGCGRQLHFEVSHIIRGTTLQKQYGLSVRCLKGTAPLGMIELKPEGKELIKITDLLGRETEYKPNTVLIYVYSDGTTEKMLNFE